ncbi:DUF1428 domain-containing protein [Parasphingorhabdus sp.]|uniref:DUF1428 domain-containing protein n=1 Tax=Parasphingorhabdus sp. TaxID=2709688 RepID=UPI003265CB14
MSYVDGFVLACPKANKEAFIEHAKLIDPMFLEFGATRVMECWQDDLSKGETTDFYRAVQAKDDEAVCFSWIEWPDKQTRDTGMAKLEEVMATDPRMDAEKNPMPFDGKRMIYGSFTSVFSAER